MTIFTKLEEIFELENAGLFYEALKKYSNLYDKNNEDYFVWKHFYFFLWISLEEAPKGFCEENNVRFNMQTLLKEGEEYFSEIADFNFITGYTISVFPYEFGGYDDMKQKSINFLQTAIELEPNNILYTIALYGNKTNISSQIKKNLKIILPSITNKFAGKGFLNRYFYDFLIRF